MNDYNSKPDHVTIMSEREFCMDESNAYYKGLCSDEAANWLLHNDPIHGELATVRRQHRINWSMKGKN